MATTVRITETYDMKTTVGKIGLVGIHTPTMNLINKLYPGLSKNHRFIRFLKADVVGACASVLPLDPLQIGVSEGDVAPEDTFNPILYTAVTNESFDTLVARVRKLDDVSRLNSVSEGELGNYTANANFSIYYGMLAENKKFRKSMPQAGFNIRGLVPLAHQILSNYGNVGSIGNAHAMADNGETSIEVPDMDVPVVQDNTIAYENAVYFRGKSVKMPKFPLHVTHEEITDIPNPTIPETFVLALVLPPARLHEFYYRMRVTWTIRFENVCSTLEAGKIYGVYTAVGDASRGTNYTASRFARDMGTETDMVTSDDVNITKIMES